MDSATTFGPTIIIPFIASDNLPDTILYGGIVLANADFGTDHFKHFDMLGSAFSPGGMTALSCITHHQPYKHVVFTFLPPPYRTRFRKNGRLSDDILDIVRSAEVRSVEVRSAEVRSAEVRSAEVRSAEVRSVEVRSAEVRSAEVRSAEVRSAEVRSAEVRSAEVRSAGTRFLTDPFCVYIKYLFQFVCFHIRDPFISRIVYPYASYSFARFG